MYGLTPNIPSHLLNWQNPVNRIKDPLKQRWAEIVQVMDTHINGVCPLHIYINRRPLESQNPYAIEYRVNNFQPLTKGSFDKFINGVIDVCSSANIQKNVPEVLQDEYYIKGKGILSFCNSDLIRIRENDPNAVIVVMPEIDVITESSVSIKGVEIVLIHSKDIISVTDKSIEFNYDTIGDRKIIVNITNGQYSLKVTEKNGTTEVLPIVNLKPIKPYISISDNVVYEGKYVLRLPYTFGAAAWGDKFYGQESDFTVQATRYTYLKEIRAKERCDEAGMIFLNGKHCSVDTTQLCQKCGGSGFVKDDSPLGTIYVDYSKLNGEERAFPQVVQWAEPPQSALTSSKDITQMYFDNMCEALGLLKQNYTNQSAVSKSFDWKEKLSTIYKIFNNNIRVASEIYRHIEYLLVDENNQTSSIYLIGELGTSSLDELLERLTEAKKNMSPPYIIMGFIDQIYNKTLPREYSDLIIKVAKDYNKLYIYGSDELTTAKAQLGNSITERDVIINNTIIDVINDYLRENGMKEYDEIVAYLDEYYAKYIVPTQTATTLGLL